MSSECGWSDVDTPRQNISSKWLHDTTSDFKGKLKAVESLLEPTGPEVYQKRPAILKILEELKGSFISLAQSHYQLRSISPKKFDDSQTMESSEPESVIEDPENSHSDLDHKFVIKDIEKPADNVVGKTIISSPSHEFRSFDGFEWETTEAQNKFEVIRLIEENLREQAELVRRNEEKRVTIQRLQAEIKNLRAEVGTLQECLTCRGISPGRTNSSRSSVSSPFKISRLGGVVMGKIFGRSLSRTDM